MNNNFGEKIMGLRKRRGLKQDDLAKCLNLSRSQSSNLEKGRRNLSLRQLESLSELFKVDVSYFFMSDGTDECLDLIEKFKLIFDSKKISKEQKEDLFASIMKIYLDSKDK